MYRIDRPVVSVLVLDTVLDCQDSELIKYLALILQEYRISKKLLVKLMEAKYWAMHSGARHICSLAGTNAHTCTHMRVHVHTHIHARIHACTHACLPYALPSRRHTMLYPPRTSCGQAGPALL